MRFCEHPSGCVYPVFGTDKLTGKGYCKRHQWSRTDTDKRSIGQKTMDKIKEKIKEGGSVSRETEEKSSLDIWFENIAKKVIKPNPYCWETGDYLSECDYRASTCHIFPKKQFPSIRTHPLNYLILSPRNGSHDKTHRMDTFAKMDVFPIAIKRFKEFEPLITEKHKYLDLFKKYAEEYEEMMKTKPNIEKDICLK